MRTPCTALASLLVMALLTASCQKIGDERGPLPLEKTVFENAISLEYGELISVTFDPGRNYYLLWFVKPDKTIVTVGVSADRTRITPQAAIIPRR